MRERNIVVLALSPLLSKVSGKDRIPKADIFGGVVKRVAQIPRASLFHVRVGSRQRKLPGLVSRGRHTGIGEDFELKNLKYHKIIILSDADQDGAHIRALLLTFFYRYTKELITGGHVYMGMPPLYKVQKGNNVTYAYDDEELARITKGMKGYTLQRYKGLGEMNPEQLWETTLNPENRSLVQVTIEDAAYVEHLVTLLMGDKVAPRKEYITEHANFNRVDSFEDKIG